MTASAAASAPVLPLPAPVSLHRLHRNMTVKNRFAAKRTVLQVGLARTLMETYSFQEIVWTDTDVVWLRDPRPFFALHPTADIAIQTDCLSHVVEANFTGHPSTASRAAATCLATPAATPSTQACCCCATGRRRTRSCVHGWTT